MLNDNLKRTKWGFYEFKNTPTDEELFEFYSKEYYQNESSLYKHEYDSDELKHIDFINNLVIAKIKQLNPCAKTVADVGCGEGYLLKEFKKHRFSVKGFDFSKDGINRLNPTLLPFFTQGNILETVKDEFKSKKYDVIANMSVMEHISDAKKLAQVLKSGMHDDTILVIKVPNDFSPLHKKLLEKNKISNPAWVSYPQHLRYFNRESLTRFLNYYGVEVISVIADYPRDIFLLNDEFNYYKKPEVGSLIYKQNLETDLFLSELDINKVIELYEAYADLGLGRSLTYFCKLKKEQ